MCVIIRRNITDRGSFCESLAKIMAQLINRGHNGRRLSRHLFQLLKDYPFLYGDAPRTTYQRVKHLIATLVAENSSWARYMDLYHQEKTFHRPGTKTFSPPLTPLHHKFQLQNWFLHHFIYHSLSISYVICVNQLIFHFSIFASHICWSKNIFSYLYFSRTHSTLSQ